MRLFILSIFCLTLTACNSIYLKPNTLDTTKIIYAQRGGFSMRKSVKETMEKRGYNITVGILKSTSPSGLRETVMVPEKAKYAVSVHERREFLRPIWCVFNGFWWWNFEISISDRIQGDEILSWRGRGCANSSVDKFNKILDEIEMKQ